MRAAIITISTSLSEGRGADESGPALVEFARGLGAEIAVRGMRISGKTRLLCRLTSPGVSEP